MLVCCLAPLGAYAIWFHHVNGPSSPYGLTSWGGRFLYARVAPFADCTKFTPPANERHLCPIDPVGHRPRVYGSSVEYYMWGRSNSPLCTLPVTDEQRRELAGDFAKRVIKAQPLTYAKTVLHDFLRPFYPVPARRDGELPVFRWQFQTFFPLFFADEYQYYVSELPRGPAPRQGPGAVPQEYRSTRLHVRHRCSRSACWPGCWPRSASVAPGARGCAARRSCSPRWRSASSARPSSPTSSATATT